MKAEYRIVYESNYVYCCHSCLKIVKFISDSVTPYYKIEHEGIDNKCDICKILTGEL